MKYFAEIGSSDYIGDDSALIGAWGNSLEMPGPNPGGCVAAKSSEDETKGVWIEKQKSEDEITQEINEKTTKSILKGFEFKINLSSKKDKNGFYEALEAEERGKLTTVLFKYDYNEQINFQDYVNDAKCQIDGTIDPKKLELRGYVENEPIDILFSANLLLTLYFDGALVHKYGLIKEGRKQKLEAKNTLSV